MRNKDNDSILVSVIIPIYNASKYLERCLSSLCKQSLNNIEIICIDDGSTDNSAQIIKKFENKYKNVKAYYIENNGAAYARNLGLSSAIGDYVIFLDADDYFYKSFLERMYTTAVKEDVDIVLCRCEGYDVSSESIINMDWTVKRDLMPHGDRFSWRDNTENLFTFCIGWAWDKLYRREFLNKTNLQFQSLRTSNDAYFVFSSLYKAKSIYFLDERLILQTRNLKSSLSQTRDKSWECFYEAIKAIKEDMISFGVYDDLEKSFMNWCVQFIVWNYTTLSLDTKQELLYKIKNEIEPYLNICDHGLTFFRDRTKFLQYASLVAEEKADDADANIKKIDSNRNPRLFLWGSCVSRAIFNLPNNYILAGYLFRNPLHTIFSAPVFQHNVKVDDLEGSSAFLKRQLFYEINKLAEYYFKTHPADYLLIDLADLRLHYVEILNYAGELSRLSIHDASEATLAKFIEQSIINEEDIKSKNVFEISNKEWKWLLNAFIEMILKYYPQNRIILNQTVFHERYVEDNSILPFVSSRYKDAKLLIDRLEKQMVDKLPNCYFIPTPISSYSDANNYLGLSELHSCSTLYIYKLNALDGVIKKQFSQEDILNLCKIYDDKIYQELRAIENNEQQESLSDDFKLELINDLIDEKEKEIAKKRRRLNDLREELPKCDAYKYGKKFFYPLYFMAKVFDYIKNYGSKQMLIRFFGGRKRAIQYHDRKNNKRGNKF